MTQSLSDSKILDTIGSDPEAGFRMLLKIYKTPVYWHIRRITVAHQDAEDALQETFLRVFKNLGKFKKEMSLAAWIFKIATNEAIRIREKHKEHTFPLDDMEAEAKRIMADEYFDYSDIESLKLQKAILSLPPNNSSLSISDIMMSLIIRLSPKSQIPRRRVQKLTIIWQKKKLSII